MHLAYHLPFRGEFLRGSIFVDLHHAYTNVFFAGLIFVVQQSTVKTTKIGPFENFPLHSNSFVLDSSTHVCVLVSFSQGEQSLEVVHCQYCQYCILW